MRDKDIVFAALAVIAAGTCIYLGVWQLDRLAERRAFNDQLRSRAAMAPVNIDRLPSDTGAAHYRRITLEGTYDFAHEFVLTNRSRQGSPGVQIVTPLRMPGRDSAVLVNRGWVYAPDAMTADLSRWREPARMTGDAYVENFRAREGSPAAGERGNAYRWMDRPTLSQEIPYPISVYYAVLIGDSGATPANVPPRLTVPPLDEGPHRSYAIQWFSFATISIIGMILFLRRK